MEERTQRLTQWAETAEINRMEINDPSIGIITSGNSYQYAKEAMGGSASYLKLGMVNPLPVELIKTFAERWKGLCYRGTGRRDRVHCKKIGVDVVGKELFPRCGEFSQKLVKKLLTGEEAPPSPWTRTSPCGPPLCAAAVPTGACSMP